jgi:hypothetical protein
MKPKIRELLKIVRPPKCKSTTVPYLDFGYGLTP